MKKALFPHVKEGRKEGMPVFFLPFVRGGQVG